MRDILVLSESFKQWSPGIEYAARLAVAFDAHLTGTWICASPTMAAPSFEAPDLMAELYDATRELEEEAYAAGPAFEQRALEFGLRKASWLVAEGYLPDVLALAGSWHDLLVVERTPNTPWGSISAVGNIVLGASLPCLVVPHGAPTHVPSLETAVIAWNGSAEALRAAHAAMPLLARARRIVILHGEQRPPASMLAWRPPFDLAGYLLRHGLQAESEMLAGDGDEEVGAALLRAAERVGAGLLVMGAYGHTRFREWVLGGATRYVLEYGRVPLLLRH
ncbi:universal stress protein [Dyella sp. BiH032]|uniref:universal stress protein n=1 Tax=Dyella sp. BiH032 TaxID=3075430 RepID=UPI0028935B60|nr:universal stress protein [Dyella sp. BiH032]WNL44049.1 universal stress protein [Dyella sp. BiH032]